MSFKRKPPEGNVRLVASNGQNIRGVTMSKAGRIVQFESWAERGMLLRLDRDPEVVDYCSQPERFQYFYEGKLHTYTPDFMVWRRNGDIEIHEITLSIRQSRPDIRRREEAAREICQARGWHYIVHTEQSLPQPTELANLLALFHYRPGTYAHPEVTQNVFAQLDNDGHPVLLLALTTHIANSLNMPQPVVLAGCCHLLWHGKLATDLTKLLFVSGEIASTAMIGIAEEKGGSHEKLPR
jgi:hypothetical protein